MNKGIKYWLISILIMAFTGLNAYSQYWPQWRGPEANGIAAPGDYPVEFSPEMIFSGKLSCPARVVPLR